MIRLASLVAAGRVEGIGPQARHDLLGLFAGELEVDGISTQLGILGPPDRPVGRDAHRLEYAGFVPNLEDSLTCLWCEVDLTLNSVVVADPQRVAVSCLNLHGLKLLRFHLLPFRLL